MRKKVRSTAHRASNHALKPNPREEEIEKLVEDLNEFEEFRTKILPAIRKDLLAGLTPDELREKYASLVQARLIAEALTTPDAGKAGTLAKDILDRQYGKATEKKEVTVKYSDLDDESLDALLLSEEEDLRAMKTTGQKPN